jgi:hypothetical protein
MFYLILQHLPGPPTRHGARRERQQARPLGQELESRQLLAAIVMSEQEQLLLELINRARLDPAAEAARYSIDLNEDLEPETISPDPKQPLAPNQMLITAARRHSDDMLAREFFEHVNPDGDGPTERARAAGYTASVGENIAWYGNPGFLERDEEVARRHEALFLSPPHRTNMLNRGYREAGNGVRFGEFSRLNSIMVSEEFGNRGGDFFITGVAYNDTKVADSFYTIGESLGSVAITATRSRDGSQYSATTGPSGGYALQVPNGVYTVTARGAGLSETMVVESVVMLGGNGKVDFNTRLPQVGTITGTLFNDVNRNGIRDVNEAALADRRVFLDADDDGELDSDESHTQSDALGVYRFSSLRVGSYTIREELPPGWETTVPVEAGFQVTVSAGHVRSGTDVGSVMVNATPVAQPDTYSTVADQVVSMDVFANDHDEDGHLVLELTQIHVAPQHGTVALNKTAGRLVYTPASGFTGNDHFDYAVVDDGGLQSEPVRVALSVTPAVGKSWQNPLLALDVSGDTFVTSIDALQVLNVINRDGAGPLSYPTAGHQPPPYLDVTGDGFVSPLDSLLVLNEINRIAAERRLADQAEGEGPTRHSVSDPSRVPMALLAAAVDTVFDEPLMDRSRRSRPAAG